MLKDLMLLIGLGSQTTQRSLGSAWWWSDSISSQLVVDRIFNIFIFVVLLNWTSHYVIEFRIQM
jgi:hypothetical protein